jgi:uncharacterized protein with FMN-binding domain
MKIKKVLLSFFAIVAFGVYAAYRYFGGQGQIINITPNPAATEQPSVTPAVSSSNPPATPVPGTATPRPVVATPTPVRATPKPVGGYRDGSFTGNVVDAYYGNVQVKALISNGRIYDVQFLDYPQDRNTSREINSQAMPILKSEAIQTQNANVDIVSGASATSQAFIESLTSALAQAK